jgi:arginyl-tRNA synthetase
MKRKQHNKILESLAQGIEMALNKAFPDSELPILDIYGQIAEPPNLKMGHFAFPCFPYSKALRMAPNKISEALKEVFETQKIIEEVRPVGPYLNFFVNFNEVGRAVLDEVLQGDFFKFSLISSPKKTMIEYSQPNTHKVLHVGHMRNLCLGNALSRIMNYTGYDITAVTYPGDVGTHVAKCLWYLKKYNQAPLPSENKGAWLGELYTKAHLKLEDELGSEKEDQNRKELTAILKQLHDFSGEYYELWQETREWSLALMKEAYQWADVEFDRWFFESEMDSPSVSLIKEYHKKGLFKESQGAIGIDLAEDGLGFCILLKSDGTGLYATKDIHLAKEKFEEFGIEKSIYIVDTRQSHHFKQVFKVLEKMGFEQADDCHHLQYDVVELPDGAMSSRKGNIIPLMDLIHQMEETIKKDYLNKYLESEEPWTIEEINKTATMIANGAIKYGMIKVDNTRKIVFDMKEWLKLDGDTGPYLQYVNARIFSLCRKLNYQESTPINWQLLTSGYETSLILKITHFNSIVEAASEQFKTSHLCSYLFELGKLFNSFYSECPIGKAESEELKNTRLALAKACGMVMQKGLALLGIGAPKKM